MKSPGRPDRQALRGTYESVMRALARVVTDRRWAAPLSAMALGFGLFLGVAIGPGTDGSLATRAGQIVAVSLAEPEREMEAGGSEGGGGASPPRSEPAAEPFEAEAAFEPEPFEEFVPAAPSPEPEAEPAAPPPEPDAEEEGGEGESVEVKGAVVRANPAAGSYTVATGAGELISIHAPKLPALGAKLEVEATPLPNSTFLEQRRSSGGSATGASLSGVVTHVDADPAEPAYTVSGRGSSILVHVDPAPAPELPVPGAYVKVGVRIEPMSPPAPPAPEPVPPPPLPAAEPMPYVPAPACVADSALRPPPRPAKVLTQSSIEAEPEPATYFDLAGIVSAICPESGELLLSADDLRESGADISLLVPAEFKLAKLKVGDSFLATATLGEDGLLTLAGLASDEGSKGAEDVNSAQGDLAR